jgi:hypothetical protein
MYWTVGLSGGPRRVNHAAVDFGDKVYSFGGYCSGDNYSGDVLIDIYVLDTGWLCLFFSIIKFRRRIAESTNDNDVSLRRITDAILFIEIKLVS